MRDREQNDSRLLPGKSFQDATQAEGMQVESTGFPELGNIAESLGNPRCLEFTRQSTRPNGEPLVWHIKFWMI